MMTRLPDTHGPDLPSPLHIHTQVTTLITPLRCRLSTFSCRKPFESTHCFQPSSITLPAVPKDNVPQTDLISFDGFVEQQIN